MASVGLVVGFVASSAERSLQIVKIGHVHRVPSLFL